MAEIFAFLKSNADVTNAAAALAGVLISVAALVVSIASIFIAVRTLKHQRVHDVLSVRPIPMLATVDLEDRISVNLRNNGIGPMFIRRLHAEDGAARQDYLRLFLPALPAGVLWSTYAGKIEDMSLAAGEQVTLLELTGQEATTGFAAFRDNCRRALAPLSIVVDYTDVYGTSFANYRESLAWYGRTRGERQEDAPVPVSVAALAAAATTMRGDA
jgi:hypothetical protein